MHLYDATRPDMTYEVDWAVLNYFTCQETFGHSRLSSLSHCELILELRVELVRAG